MIQLEDKDWYDVAIIGAGPGGATCAYFLGKYPLGVSDPQGVKILQNITYNDIFFISLRSKGVDFLLHYFNPAH